MKYFTFIFLPLLISCSPGNKNQTNQISGDANYGSQLLESGFLEFADTLKLDSLKTGLINSFDIYNEGNNKIAHIDAEELAEFSFGFFQPRLQKMLEKRNFKFTVQPAGDYETTYDVLINGEKIKLYTKEEMEKLDFWDLASRNFFEELNKQLQNKKIDESFYLLYGGNDLHVMLLTSDQQKIIADKYKNDTKETPYLP